MDALDAILTRRSIREYDDKEVESDKRHLLLKAGMQAPSANNYQPWHFIVIDERQILDQIPTFHPYSTMLKQAPFAIAVCGDQRIEDNIGYLALNCAAATQNILIAAHALSLGAVWLGIYPRTERITKLSNLLKLPEHVIPISLIAVGYPAEEKPTVDRFQNKRIHINSW
jgi:nitroreductase